jgi:hypothetical protein
MTVTSNTAESNASAGEERIEALHEYASSAGVTLRVDRALGVIHGVKIVGLESLNKRSYTPGALSRAMPLYEGAKVNIDHRDEGQRVSYAQRIGAIKNVAQREDGLYADFHFNPKHQLAEQLCWDAENAPQNVGFSHDANARTTRRDGKVIVEEIVKVHSVDLVANPATTHGLFEGEPGDKLAAENRSLKESLAAVRKEHDALKLKEAEQAKTLAIAEELKTAGLNSADKTAVSEAFTAQLMAAPDAATRKTLIEDRQRLLRRAIGSTSITGAAPLRPVREDVALGDRDSLSQLFK